jgi:ADP-ribosylglycohydrolase
MKKKQDRYLGCLIGLAVGDALGTTLEFKSPGSFKYRQPPEIQGSGYVVKSLEAALWAFYKSKTFEEGCLLAVNLGDDADTTGAVYGQLAGAFYGLEAIPRSWSDKLAQGELILSMAEKIFSFIEHYS